MFRNDYLIHFSNDFKLRKRYQMERSARVQTADQKMWN